jgi:hypothetical protein
VIPPIIVEQVVATIGNAEADVVGAIPPIISRLTTRGSNARVRNAFAAVCRGRCRERSEFLALRSDRGDASLSVFAELLDACTVPFFLPGYLLPAIRRDALAHFVSRGALFAKICFTHVRAFPAGAGAIRKACPFTGDALA